MFSKDSYIVQVWVKSVRSGVYTREQVPKLSNLQTIVYNILDESTK